ncbi:MAG: hypothetical protein IPM29_15230 [Planctomycetes bacterium]|nr:hypothetical protein [Planctomycetota bacterium]
MEDRRTERAALWVLRIAGATMCAGLAWHRALDRDDAISALLYDDLRWCGEATVDAITGSAAALLAAAGVALLGPARIARAAALLVCAWVAVLCVAEVSKEPLWPETVPGAWAVRWLGPLALAAWLGRRARGLPGPGRAEWLLRAAAASTFLFHGFEAAGVRFLAPGVGAPHGEFVDFLFTAQRAAFDTALSEDTNRALLRGIGALDATVALLLLLGRWPAVALWMTCWGLLTAGLRVLEYDQPGWSLALIRVPNGGVPAALALCWLHRAPARAATATILPPRR